MTVEDKKTEQPSDFVKSLILKAERKSFAIRIIGILIGYIVITLGLNAIRAIVPLWFVWVFIIAQWLLYFLIFTISYQRAKDIDLKTFGIIPFIILAALGKVNDLELIIIPATIIVMLIISARSRKLSAHGQSLLPKNT